MEFMQKMVQSGTQQLMGPLDPSLQTFKLLTSQLVRTGAYFKERLALSR